MTEEQVTAIHRQDGEATIEPPRRRYRLTLDLGADSLPDLAHVLEHLAFDIVADGRDWRTVTSGGWSTGYHYTLVCDPDMDGDRFRAENAEYVKHLRSSKEADRG